MSSARSGRHRFSKGLGKNLLKMCRLDGLVWDAQGMDGSERGTSCTQSIDRCWRSVPRPMTLLHITRSQNTIGMRTTPCQPLPPFQTRARFAYRTYEDSGVYGSHMQCYVDIQHACQHYLRHPQPPKKNWNLLRSCKHFFCFFL